MKKIDKLIGVLDSMQINESIEKEEIMITVWGNEKETLKGTFDTTYHHARVALPHKLFCGKFNKSVTRLK
jgi:thymidine phosphorylase